MTFVLMCHGIATAGVESPPDLAGQYLESFDVDAYDGMGTCSWTVDEGRAMKFADLTEAVEVWRTQSKVRPLRADGRPNRPLTSFSVEPRML